VITTSTIRTSVSRHFVTQLFIHRKV